MLLQSPIMKWLLLRPLTNFMSLNPMSPFLKFYSYKAVPCSHLLWYVFFDVGIMMDRFFASSHTHFRHDLKRIRKCDKFKVKSWYKIEWGLFFMSSFFKKKFSKLFAPEFFVSKEKTQKCLTSSSKKISANYSLWTSATK